MHIQPTGAVHEQVSGLNSLNGSRCSNYAMMHKYAHILYPLNEATYQNFGDSSNFETGFS